jgi:hypothetical protein
MGKIDIFMGRELEFGIHMFTVMPFTKSKIDLYWMSIQYVWELITYYSCNKCNECMRDLWPIVVRIV